MEALREQCAEKSRQLAAAKAVLNESKKGIRTGTILSAEEISFITEPILNPPAQEEMSDEEEAVASSPQKGFSFFESFTAVQKKDVEEPQPEEISEEQVKEIVSRPATKKSSPFSSVISFLDGEGREQSPEKEIEEEEETVVVPIKEEIGEKEAPKAPAQKEEINIFNSIGKMFGVQEAVFVDELEQPNDSVVEKQYENEQTIAKEQEEQNMNVLPDNATVEETILVAAQEDVRQNGNDNIPDNVREAREWIAAWRNRHS